MSSHKPDVDHAIRIIDLHNQPVFIPGNIENHAVTANDTGAAKHRLNCRGPAPVRPGNFTKPCLQWLFSIGIPPMLPEFPKSLPRYNSHALHLEYLMIPWREQGESYRPNMLLIHQYHFPISPRFAIRPIRQQFSVSLGILPRIGDHISPYSSSISCPQHGVCGIHAPATTPDHPISSSHYTNKFVLANDMIPSEPNVEDDTQPILPIPYQFHGLPGSVEAASSTATPFLIGQC